MISPSFDLFNLIFLLFRPFSCSTSLCASLQSDFFFNSNKHPNELLRILFREEDIISEFKNIERRHYLEENSPFV